MPNPSSGAVPIPTINQTVATPNADLEANPFHAEPINDAIGPALEQAGGQLFGIFKAQQDHADAIDVAQRMGQFQQDFGQAKVAALNSGQTGPQMVSTLQGASSKLIDKYTSGTTDPNHPNPPNYAVARQLSLAMNQHVAEQMSSFPSEAAERVSHDLDFKFAQQTSTAAASIGQNYTIAGTADAPVFQLNADGLAAMNRQIATIDQAYPPDARPTENAFYRNMLAQKAALQTGMAIAQDHPSLIDAFIKQHADVLPPEQQMQLTNRATSAIDLPMRQINASNTATRAQLLQKYTAQVQNGTLDTADLDNAAAHQLISRDDYQRITGYQFMPPGNPGAIAAMNKQISSTTDENDLETLRGTINGPANAELYGKGAIPLNAAIENQKRNLQTVEGQQRRQDSDQIRRAYQTVPGAGPLGVKLYNMSASLSGTPTLAELHANALADYNAATFGIHDPAKLAAARAKAIKDNALDTSLVRPKTGSPVPAVGPPAITDGEARTITAHARKIGLIR